MFNNIFRSKKNNIDFEDVLAEASFTKKENKEDFWERRIGVNISNSSIYFLFIITILISGFLIYQAYLLGILNYYTYAQKSVQNNYIRVAIPSVRGAILDRNGEVLAKTVQVKDLNNNSYTREYIKKEGFGNILGYVTYPKKDKQGVFWQESMEGVEGLEKYYNLLLTGKNGTELYEKNAKGGISGKYIAENPMNGRDINISIDSKLQDFVYKNIKDFVEKYSLAGGSFVLMDIDTGEILSLVSYPTYDSNLLLPETSNEIIEEKATDTITRNEYYKKLLDNKKTPFLNRPISGTYTPGSIVKPLFGLAGLNTKNITKESSFFSKGYIEVPSQVKGGKAATFRDWKAHGWTNLAEAIAVSSDVYFYTLVGGYGDHKGLGIQIIDEYAKAFNFDKTTGIDLFGEKFGNISSPSWKMKTLNEAWRLGDTYNSSIGQYGFTITPIGAASLVSTIVNNGKIVTPHLYLDDSFNQSTNVNINIKDEYYDSIKKGMRLAVTYGTAKSLNLPYVEVAAKTGTAEIGNSKRYVNSWVTGFFPYNKPKYSFAIITEKGNRDNVKSPIIVMKDIFEWMSLYRPKYLGLTEAEAFLIRSKNSTTTSSTTDSVDNEVH